MTPRVRVEMVGITKRCPRVLANKDASLTAYAGEVHAIVGQNGAGKSTLMKILYGLVPPDAGRIAVDGRPLVRHTPADAIRAGIGMVFQHFMLVESLTVAENVVLGREPRRGLFGRAGARRHGYVLDRAAMRAEVRAVADRFGLALDPDALVEQCSVGAQQRVEIAKVLLRGAEILILDEPTAVLTPEESDTLMATLKRLAGEGKAIILITHKLREVMTAADRVTIMRAGETIETLAVHETTAENVAEKMIGRQLAQVTPHPRRPREGEPRERSPVLTVESLTARSDRGVLGLDGVSLEVGRGEILGIAGIEGNGQSELLECISGLRPALSGRVSIAGRDLTTASPRARFAAGLAHVPENRHDRGVVLDLSVEENAILGGERAFSRPFGLDFAAIRRHAEAIIRAQDVRPPDPRAPIGPLSGGNQQKLVLGRELARNPKLLLAGHPTRGLDVFASRAVHDALRAAADGGTGVLLVSADLTELLALADRILVLFEGRVAGVVDPTQADERKLGLLMAGRGAAS